MRSLFNKIIASSLVAIVFAQSCFANDYNNSQASSNFTQQELAFAFSESNNINYESLSKEEQEKIQGEIWQYLAAVLVSSAFEALKYYAEHKNDYNAKGFMLAIGFGAANAIPTTRGVGMAIRLNYYKSVVDLVSQEGGKR